MIIKKNIALFIRQISDQENLPYKSFIKLHSDELKYMTPWAMYDKDYHLRDDDKMPKFNDEITDALFFQDKIEKK